jgi:Reverse transcriptase (RNA-dependent DNA polymerase)
VDDDGGDPVINIATEMEARHGPQASGHNLQPRKLQDHSHMHTIFTEAGSAKPSRPCDYSHRHNVLQHIAMTQHGLKQGLKEFGDAGIDAVLKELKQLHDRQVIEAVNPTTMTREQKRAALHYLMFLKKKRCGRIKGRGCAEGQKQHLYTPKEEASSPTVAIKPVILSCVIDANENRNVATVDLPGVFMHADMDEEVFMKLEGKMAELLVQLDPDRYAKCITSKNRKNTLHVRLKKALYGMLKAALLFWKHLSGKLQGWGFVRNPYDSCVVNKDIDGAQYTILWHVDDLKISHVDPGVVTNVIKQLEAEFGKEAPLTINRGKTHEYLGMTIDYSTPGKVKIGMVDYVRNMLDKLPEDMKGESATPAANHLFQVDNAAEKLSSDKSIMFHHNAAKLLFLCKRACPDVQTATAFLCTRVKAPDIDDYKKLGRVMHYLRTTHDMVLTLESNSVNIIKWWVDASFAVHPDMKSHTGAVMSLGRGAMYSTSMRQKLNGRSSTEGELIGVSDVLPQILWTRYFLEAQGYTIKESIVYQDNQSAILLEKNG